MPSRGGITNSIFFFEIGVVDEESLGPYIRSGSRRTNPHVTTRSSRISSALASLPFLFFSPSRFRFSASPNFKFEYLDHGIENQPVQLDVFIAYWLQKFRVGTA